SGLTATRDARWCGQAPRPSSSTARARMRGALRMVSEEGVGSVESHPRTKQVADPSIRPEPRPVPVEAVLTAGYPAAEAEGDPWRRRTTGILGPEPLEQQPQAVGGIDVVVDHQDPERHRLGAARRVLARIVGVGAVGQREAGPQ